ncbi:MAG: hypothetical protein KatS3mg022_1566 [Armatimonadota bacterium]|nr:MAG: hypothetical protein KatS3mg022_1566 [Armatimonadota bacterium]
MRQHVFAFVVALAVWMGVMWLSTIQRVKASATGGLFLECTFVHDTWIVPQCGAPPGCTGFCSKRVYHTYRCKPGGLLDYCTESIEDGVFYEYYTTNCVYHAPGCSCNTNWTFQSNHVGSWWRC